MLDGSILAWGLHIRPGINVHESNKNGLCWYLF